MAKSSMALVMLVRVLPVVIWVVIKVSVVMSPLRMAARVFLRVFSVSSQSVSAVKSRPASVLPVRSSSQPSGK